MNLGLTLWNDIKCSRGARHRPAHALAAQLPANKYVYHFLGFLYLAGLLWLNAKINTT